MPDAPLQLRPGNSRRKLGTTAAAKWRALATAVLAPFSAHAELGAELHAR